MDVCFSMDLFRMSYSLAYSKAYDFEDLIQGTSLRTCIAGNRDRFIKLILLGFFQHSLKMQNALLQRIMDLQEGRLFKDREAEYYEKTSKKNERLFEDTIDLADAVDFIAASLEIDSNYLDLEGRPTSEIKQRISEVRLEGAQQRKFAARILERDEREFALSQSIRSIHESEGVKRLTVLAAVFLPLSLDYQSKVVDHLGPTVETLAWQNRLHSIQHAEQFFDFFPSNFGASREAPSFQWFRTRESQKEKHHSFDSALSAYEIYLQIYFPRPRMLTSFHTALDDWTADDRAELEALPRLCPPIPKRYWTTFVESKGSIHPSHLGLSHGSAGTL